MAKILIGADIVPTKTNEMNFIKGEMSEIISEDLMNLLMEADYRIFNLETPLCNSGKKIIKYGKNFKANPSCVEGLKKLKIDLLTLANNHIMDYGNIGLFETLNSLRKYNINYIGVGENLKKIKKSHIIILENIKIGIYSCVENEFSVAERNKAGANPYDPLNIFDDIELLKKECDYLIILYHGGKEHYRYPSPNLQKVCHKFVEKGANLILCQHSHCIGAKEEYKDSIIVYGQGNFLFDSNDSDYWKTSLLIKVEIKEEKVSVDYIPIIKIKNGVKLPSLTERNKILKDFLYRSKEILQDNFIEEQYEKFAKKNLNNYLKVGVPFSTSLVMRLINKLFLRKLYLIFVNKQRKIIIYNYLRCEAHHELFITGLKKYLKN